MLIKSCHQTQLVLWCVEKVGASSLGGSLYCSQMKAYLLTCRLYLLKLPASKRFVLLLFGNRDSYKSAQ